MLFGANDGARTRDNQNRDLLMKFIFHKTLRDFLGMNLKSRPPKGERPHIDHSQKNNQILIAPLCKKATDI